MYYDKFINGLGFWLQKERNRRPIVIKNWEHLIRDMLYEGRIEIWHTVKPCEVSKAECFYTNSTPKLRKLMRRVQC